ncbi:MFAP5 protein, partial [Atractosteus spatula]|nr:MFAP5 protein [Atractosteus spatula]
MGRLPVTVLLCSIQVLLGVGEAQDGEVTYGPVPGDPSQATLTPDCREETYPCTRMYSVHRPTKRCIHSICIYSYPRVYIINKEICVRIVCQEEEALKADLCRVRAGYPRRLQRSLGLCGRRKTWAHGEA